jgi:hypothetical protein
MKNVVVSMTCVVTEGQEILVNGTATIEAIVGASMIGAARQGIIGDGYL